MTRSAFVYDMVRTPFGRYAGALAAYRPDDLAALVVAEQVRRAPRLAGSVNLDEVYFGNANGAGEDNRNVARMAVLLAELPVTVPGSTVNRLCGSGMDAAIMAARTVETGDGEVVIAGGVESMTRAPLVLPKNDKPFQAGDLTLSSTTLGWRLVNPKMDPQWTVSLGEATEQLRQRYHVDRDRQDAFALRSHQLATKAWDEGMYDDQIVEVAGVDLTRDESIRSDTDAARLASLKTVFRPEDGTVTAGNSSPLSDGAAAMLIGSQQSADQLGLAPLARVAGRAATANEPQNFGYAPVEAANRALQRAGVQWSDIGAVELNEAFAAQSVACVDGWAVDPELVNAWGGAIAIGHPLGASGVRVLGTLARRLERTGARWGVAAICIGVGQGLAVVLENVRTA